jgi:hypothetical protein
MVPTALLSLRKEVVLRIFIDIKYPSSSAEFEPANIVSSGNTLTTRPPKVNLFYITSILSNSS